MPKRPNKPDHVWVKPANAVKAHYFVNGKTLCGGIFFNTNPAGDFLESDKCVICLRKGKTRNIFG